MDTLYDPTNSRYRHLDAKAKDIYRRYTTEEEVKPNSNSVSMVTEVPSHGSYNKYLFRPEWKAKRNEIITRDKHCVVCSNNTSLQVHHRQYHFMVNENRFRYPWEYADYLMITLCESCHKRGHSKFKVPIINI